MTLDEGQILLLLGGIFGGIGALMLVIGFFWLLARLRFVLKGTKAMGVITGSEMRTSHNSEGHSSVHHHPTVRFQTAHGQQVDFVSQVGTGRMPQVGKSVKVIYQRDDPRKAEINSPMALWFGPVFLGLMGGFFAALGVGMAVWY